MPNVASDTGESTSGEVQKVLDRVLWKVCVEQIKIEPTEASGPIVSTYPTTDVDLRLETSNVDFRENSSDSDYDSDLELKGRITCDNSDEEFERITSLPMQRMRKLHLEEYGEGKQKKNKKPPRDLHIEHEYDKLDPIDVPKIVLNPEARLDVLGKVITSVHCLVRIQTERCVVLDFDTVLFDQQRNVFGVVYDVLGNVREAIYMVRFNTVEEAAAVPVGSTIYYAPDNNGITKVLLLDELTAMKIADENADPDEDACPDFSDDEQEREYKARKKNRKRSRNSFNESNQRGGYHQQRNSFPQRNRGQHNQGQQDNRQHFRVTDWHRAPEYCYSENGSYYQES